MSYLLRVTVLCVRYKVIAIGLGVDDLGAIPDIVLRKQGLANVSDLPLSVGRRDRDWCWRHGHDRTCLRKRCSQLVNSYHLLALCRIERKQGSFQRGTLWGFSFVLLSSNVTLMYTPSTEMLLMRALYHLLLS